MPLRDVLLVTIKIEVNHLLLVSHLNMLIKVKLHRITTMEQAAIQVEVACMEISKTICKVVCHLHHLLITMEIQCMDHHLISMDHQLNQALEDHLNTCKEVHHLLTNTLHMVLLSLMVTNNNGEWVCLRLKYSLKQALVRIITMELLRKDSQEVLVLSLQHSNSHTTKEVIPLQINKHKV